MTKELNSPRRYRLQSYLTVFYVFFIIYVSLTPFVELQDQGLHFLDVLSAPPGQTFTLFDFTLNVLAYLPFGFLFAYLLHSRLPTRQVMLVVTLGAFMLSLLMEYTQIYLPSRVSSNTDLFSNTAGALAGAILALNIKSYSWFSHFRHWHDKWFKHGRVSDFGLALAALWMFAQINPSLPMLGSVFVREVARWPFDIVPAAPFNWLECSEVALNLLLMGLLLNSLLRERRHTLNVLLLVLGSVTLIKFVAAAVLLKSWALLLWLNSEALFGILAGVLLLISAMRMSSSRMFVFSVLSTTAYLVLLQYLLLDNKPSTVMRLYYWHYTHLLNYTDFSQLVILLFPFLLLAYLWRIRSLRT